MAIHRVKKAYLCVCLTATLGASGVATATTAELETVNGTAMVSEGSRYIEGQQGRALAEGDRVIALENSKVVLTFQDGCRYTLKDGEVLTVGGQSPCSREASPPDNSLPAASADSGDTDPNIYALGLIGAAAIAAVAFDTGGDGPRFLPPISP